MKRVLLLSAMETIGVAVLRALGERGLRVEVAGAGKGSVMRASRRCAKFHSVAPNAKAMAEGSDAVVEAAARAFASSGAELVVPADIAGGLLAPKLRARLKDAPFYPAPEPKTLAEVDDKWTFQEFLEKHDLPRPRAWLLRSAAELDALSGPLVCKPRVGSSGMGVRVLRDESSERPAPSEYPLVAQEYVPGDDVDLSLLAQEGRMVAWAVQVRRRGVIHYIDDPAIVEFGRRFCAAARYDGLAHLDMRYVSGSSGPAVPIECNPRFWASFLQTLALGVDFFGLGAEIAAGGRPAAIAATPTGASPTLRGVAKLLLSGQRLDRASWKQLGRVLSDPGPELRKAYLRLSGREAELRQ